MKTRDNILDEILADVGACIQRDGVHVTYSNHAINFTNKKVRSGNQELMTCGHYMICVRVDAARRTESERIPETFDYVTGTFEKQRTREHTIVVLTPNHAQTNDTPSSQINVHKLRLLLENAGDIIEETGKIRIVRHYKFPVRTP
jgi:hypothetical protein